MRALIKGLTTLELIQGVRESLTEDAVEFISNDRKEFGWPDRQFKVAPGAAYIWSLCGAGGAKIQGCVAREPVSKSRTSVMFRM